MTNHLDRFIKAQTGIFEVAINEISAGKKRTHWMWFIFPQLRGLGYSENANFYGLADLDEAKRYIEHRILGSRLKQATHCVLSRDTPADDIFDETDYQKFVSCMTLFAFASSPGSIFHSALRALSTKDMITIEMLGEKHDVV